MSKKWYSIVANVTNGIGPLEEIVLAKVQSKGLSYIVLKELKKLYIDAKIK